MHGCNADGSLNDSDFSRPLPLIGLYIAASSLVCAVLMAHDLVEGFRQRRLWFPSKSFPLNAATLTLLGVAVKFPLDLNTNMPGRWDQLAKLSGGVLVCTVMGNLMPSLGVTDNVFTNTFALAVLVVTVIGNMVAQMSTGVIYAFRHEHYIVISFMLVLLAITVSSALTVSTTKDHLEQRYNSTFSSVYREQEGQEKIDSEFLERGVHKYWLMAHTCSPQYVLGRAATCTASGAFCLLSALVLIQALVRSFLQHSMGFCSGTSDYRWSTTVVAVSQGVAILVGTIAPAWRCFSAISFRDTREGLWDTKADFSVEKYWVQMLKEWRESPLPPGIRRRLFRKAGHRLRNPTLAVLIAAQVAIVMASKLVRLLSLCLAGGFCWVKRLPRRCTSLLRKESRRGDPEAAVMNEAGGAAQDSEDLRDFVLHLEGEEQLVKLITRSGRRDSRKLIEKGRKEQPAHLALLLAHASPGFRRVGQCGISTSDEMFPGREINNCWALPIATLAGVALALPGIDRAAAKSLRRDVGEALRYVRLVDTHLGQHGSVNAQEAADMVWEGVDLFGHWFGRELRMDELDQMGRTCIGKEQGRGRDWEHTDPVEWPPRVLAGICMKSMAGAIRDRRGALGTSATGLLLFEWLRGAIADAVGACLTNLPRAIHIECISSGVEVREERVRKAAAVLGESWQLLDSLSRMDHDDRLYPPTSRESVDAWASMTSGEPVIT